MVERVADGRSFIVDNLLVGLIGGFQPDKLARAFIGDEDGLYGRFLFGWPATPIYHPLTDDILEVDPEFQNLLTKLIRLPAEDEHGTFAPRTIPLAPGARKEFEAYRQFVAHTKRSIEGREQQWLPKSKRICCGLPARWHTWPGPTRHQALVWKASPLPWSRTKSMRSSWSPLPG